MSIAKPTAIAASVVVAVAAAGNASMGLSQVSKPKVAPEAGTAASKPDAGDRGRSADRADKSKSDRPVRVDAPNTTVDVGKDTGKVRVTAPYTDVKVDPGKGQVRVRAPYVDLNVRW